MTGSTIIVLSLWSAIPGRSEEVARVDGANIQRPVWSSDGTQLAWEANFHATQVVELFLGDPLARQFHKLNPAPPPSSLTQGFAGRSRAARIATDAAFAPAGIGRLAYTASTTGRDLDLVVTGSGPLAPSPGMDGGADWSPDGQWIAFTSSRTGEGDLYVIDPSLPDATPRRLTFTEHAAELHVDWSPDARSVVYVSRGSTGDHLWRIAVDGGPPVQLTRWPGSQTLPRYAPQGRSVAFYSNHVRRDRVDLYVMPDVPDAAPTLLAEDVVPNSAGPAWTPDGRAIVFTSRDDEAYNPINIVPVDVPAAVQTLPFDTIGHGDLAVTMLPDGTLRVAYVAQGRANDRNLAYRRLYVADLPP